MSELIVQDFGGTHNSDLIKTGARLIQGGSWKKQRIVMLLPADTTMHAKVCLSLMNLIYPPNNGVFRILCQGMEVGHAYSEALNQIMAHPELKSWEYLLTVEHDNLPPADGILKLVEDLEDNPELTAVSGLYFTKGEGGCTQIWGDPKDPIPNFRPQVARVDTLQECVGIGMGFALWRLATFLDPRLEKPFFKTERSAQGVCTQDLYFWSKNRKLGYRCAVDTRVKVGHVDPTTGHVW